jgi:hypothetical protein
MRVSIMLNGECLENKRIKSTRCEVLSIKELPIKWVTMGFGGLMLRCDDH